jgi:uncharacterized membrane protein
MSIEHDLTPHATAEAENGPEGPDDPADTDDTEDTGDSRPARTGTAGTRRIGWVLVVTSVLGWFAAFQLTVENWRLLKNPTYQPACDISPVVGCGDVMSSDQGSVFGFPNMLLGLAAFAVVGTLGVIVLTGSRLHRAVWLGLQGGALLGVVFVHWLIWQSLYELGKICPYCAIVWTITIALFWYLTLHNVQQGVIRVPPRARVAVDTVLDTHAILLAGWYGVIVLLILTRFWSYWSSLV